VLSSSSANSVAASTSSSPDSTLFIRDRFVSLPTYSSSVASESLNALIRGPSLDFTKHRCETASARVLVTAESSLGVSGVASFIRGFDDAVPADEVSFGRVGVADGVLFVSNGSQRAQDRCEESVNISRKIRNDDGHRVSSVTGSSVVGVTDQTNNFIVNSRASDVSCSNDSTSDVSLTDATESTSGVRSHSGGSHTEVEREVKRTSDPSCVQATSTQSVTFEVHYRSLQEREERPSRVLVSKGSGVEQFVSDGRARGEVGDRDVVTGSEVEEGPGGESDDGHIISRASSGELCRDNDQIRRG